MTTGNQPTSTAGPSFNLPMNPLIVPRAALEVMALGGAMGSPLRTRVDSYDIGVVLPRHLGSV
jgi:hypothetical protein